MLGSNEPVTGRVAIVTGAGSGLGRAYALALARAGMAVVANDLGVRLDGTPGDRAVADRVVDEIRSTGGTATASVHDVADWSQAHDLVQLAVGTFGDLHVLVTSAGFLRDRTIANMSDGEWDDVVRVHLKGQAAPTHHAMAWWRAQGKAGHTTDRSLIHVSSASGLRPSVGQANYGASKLGVIALSQVAVLEGRSFGVRANVVAPAARTRMTAPDQRVATADDPVRFDPAAVAELVVWLAGETCPANGQILYFDGRRLLVLAPSPVVARLERPGGWTIADLDRELTPHLVEAPDIEELLG